MIQTCRRYSYGGGGGGGAIGKSQTYYVTLEVPIYHGRCMPSTYRVSQNYPNMQFFAIFATVLKPLMLRLPKFAEILIKSQS